MKKTHPIHDTTLVFDLVTSGFSPQLSIHPFQVNNFDECRVIRIGYVILDNEYNFMKKVQHTVNHDHNIVETFSNMHYSNSINNVDLMFIPFGDVMEEFSKDLHTCKQLVSHNIDVVLNVLLSELYRDYIKYKPLIGTLYLKKTVCTMKLGKLYLMSVKYPKLSFLYKYIYNANLIDSGELIDNVIACAKCFIHIDSEPY